MKLLTYPKSAIHTEAMRPVRVLSLSDVKSGQRAVVDHLDLPAEEAQRLMELGFVPGNIIEPARSAPGGEPRVYRVDGSEIAIRRETARSIFVSPVLVPSVKSHE